MHMKPHRPAVIKTPPQISPDRAEGARGRIAASAQSSRRRMPVLAGLVTAVTLTLAGCGAATVGGDGTSGVVAGSTVATSSGGFAFGRDADTTSTDAPRLEKIENPTMQDLQAAGPLGDRALGRADAPVTVIEYVSLTCPHCRAFHKNTWPDFKRAYVDTGKVRYIVREFPIGRSSGNAWLVTRCADDAMMHKLIDAYLARQGEWVSQEVRTEQIFRIAQSQGMDRAKFDSCLKNQGVIDHIKWVKDRGRVLGVIGTPTFFINDRHVRQVPTMADMREWIDPLLSARVAAAD